VLLLLLLLVSPRDYYSWPVVAGLRAPAAAAAASCARRAGGARAEPAGRPPAGRRAFWLAWLLPSSRARAYTHGPGDLSSFNVLLLDVRRRSARARTHCRARAIRAPYCLLPCWGCETAGAFVVSLSAAAQRGAGASAE